MEAALSFTPSFSPSPPNPIHSSRLSRLRFCTQPSSPHHPIHGTRPKRSNLCFSTSPSSSTVPTTTTTTDQVPDAAAMAETEIQGEKFDWFSQWYPIMPVRDLDKRVPHGKTVMGLDLVAWWDRNESAWKVFDDTCPHRLAPLSEGRIDGSGRLQCVYHGWCFDGSGHCKLIPQAPLDGPPVHTNKRACVAAYPSTVQHGLLWFWANSDPKYRDILAVKKPPYISELDDPSFTKPMATREFPFGYEILTENLVDPSHVPYAHYNLLPNPTPKNKRVDREGGTPVDMRVQSSGINGFETARVGGASKFIAPCVYYSTVSVTALRELARSEGNGAAPAASEVKAASDSSSQAAEKRVLLVFFCIPVGPGRSRLIFTFPRNFAVWADRIVPRWIAHVRQNLVLDSDLYLLHLEERKIHEVGHSNWSKACFMPTPADSQVIAFRRWLRNYSGGQVNWGTKFSGELPPTPPKEQLMDRYRSHVVNCSSCSAAYKALQAIEVALQIIAVGSIAIVAAVATKQSLAARSAVAVAAVLCFAASKWLARFIYKTFHFHDYKHALV